MKTLTTLLLAALALFPNLARAWCDNPAIGTSKTFSVAVYAVSGCNPNNRFPEGVNVIEFTHLNKRGEPDGESRTVRLEDECQWTGGATVLSCPAGGNSPLAGATYITTKDMKDVCDASGKTLDNRLTCVKGCKSGKAPKHLETSPWEC